MRTKAARFAAKPRRQLEIRSSRTKLALAIAAAISGGAAFHSVPALAASASDSDNSLAEIIVTARKRAENLQDVPISIDVYTAKDLQNLSISQFEDYATLTPSISFVSAGPGTQTFVMRGVSDGSNPNYANTATTAFLLDDMSMNYAGTTPDLHLYDIERIEVLNGPQGTTFGASAMAGALRFITNKPDATAFSAGVDADAGKIDGGTHNGTIEGFVNIPLIADWTALRISAFSDYHGGFINNINTTRTWVNGVVSNNSEWAGRDYNVEKVTGARIALSQKIADGWKATVTGSYQRQLTHGAWDQDPTIGGAVDQNGNLVNGPVRSFGTHNVDRFGPEFKQYYTKTLDFHLDGDVGIGDLVYAGTYWAQDDRWVNEYSEYMQYIHTGSLNAATQQGYTCLTDPISTASNPGGPLPFSGCKAPIQYYDYPSKIERWSHEVRLQSKQDKDAWFHWLAGAYWEKTRDNFSNYYHMPGLQTSGTAWQSTAYYYGQTGLPPAPDDWYSYVSRSDELQTSEFANVVFDLTHWWHVELGAVHFHSTFNSQTYGGFWYQPQSPSAAPGSSHKWNGKAGMSFNIGKDVLVYFDAAQGFRNGGTNAGLPTSCQLSPSNPEGAPANYTPDTVTNYELGWKTTWLDKHLLWNGAVYYMDWTDFQTLVYNPGACPSSSFTANAGDARIYGMESDFKWQPNSVFSMQIETSYNDSRMKSILPQFAGSTGAVVGERLPYVPYFNWSANARYEVPVKDALHGYVQYDVAHKGDMWNTLANTGSNGLPRVLQPGYSVMDLRLGVNQVDTHWLGELYITNLTNKNAVIYTNEGNFDLRETVNEPRVFGVRASYRFGKTAAGGGED